MQGPQEIEEDSIVIVQGEVQELYPTGLTFMNRILLTLQKSKTVKIWLKLLIPLKMAYSCFLVHVEIWPFQISYKIMLITSIDRRFVRVICRQSLRVKTCPIGIFYLFFSVETNVLASTVQCDLIPAFLPNNVTESCLRVLNARTDLTKVVILIHGFLNSFQTSWLHQMQADIQELEPHTAIIVSYFTGTSLYGMVRYTKCIHYGCHWAYIAHFMKYVFFKWAIPGLFFVYFCYFQINITIFTTNICEKMSIQYTQVGWGGCVT